MPKKPIDNAPKIGTRHVTPSFQRTSTDKGPTGSPRSSGQAKAKIEHAVGQGVSPNRNPNEGRLARQAATGRVGTKRPGQTIPPSQKRAGRMKDKLG